MIHCAWEVLNFYRGTAIRSYGCCNSGLRGRGCGFGSNVFNIVTYDVIDCVSKLNWRCNHNEDVIADALWLA